MALTPGTRLGSYEILSALGAGGMGEVYRARDLKLNRDVAIKVLLPSVAGDPDRLARFSREAQVLASLNHPNIAHIHGLEESSGVTALILELVEGEDLAQRIARGPIPIDEALPIARQIAEALEAAHDHGIIHRDLKPANIKLRTDGTVKVLDFGLAKALGPAAASATADAMNSPTLSIHATQAGIILGTAAYMSPEQARGRAVDKRTDIWALGCVLFEMLTGTRAFPGDDATDTIVAVVSKEPEWTALPAAVPTLIRKLLRRSLEKDPKRRLDSAAAVRLEIDDAVSTAAVDANPASRPATHYRWTQLLPSLIAALAVLAAVVAFWYPRQRPQAGATVRFSVLPPFGAIRPVQNGFAVAPDGRILAFTAAGSDGVSRIFVRHLDEAEAQPLAGTDRAGLPFWAPDSRSVGFAREGGLYRVDLDGSAPRRLCDVPGNTFLGGSWSSRGMVVFAAAVGLLSVPDTGGMPAPVTTLDPEAKEALHTGPWFLPDGRHVLFLALATGQTRGIIWATSIDDPARIQVVESYGAAAYAGGWLFSTTAPPRALVAQPFDPERLVLSGKPQPVRDRLTNANTLGPPGFAVSSSGVLVVDRPPPILNQLVWVDRAGRTMETVGPRATINVFALAPDERRVVAQVVDRDSLARDLWLFEAGRPDGTRLTYDGATKLRPIWARDGRHIHFTERTASGLELRTLAIGATVATGFENPGSFAIFNDVTRDGRYVVFQSGTVPQEIWLQRVGNPAERRALVGGPFSPVQARVSPDLRWLAYTLSLPSGNEVFVQPFDRPGERLQVSVKGGIGPFWRDDGRELYYEGPEGLMAVATSERAGVVEAGAPQKLFSIRTQGVVSTQPQNAEAAANGQKFLINTVVGDSNNAPLEVTLNWPAGLKK